MEFFKKLVVEYVVVAAMVTLGLSLLGWNVTSATEFVCGLVGVVVIAVTIPVSITVSKWVAEL